MFTFSPCTVGFSPLHVMCFSSMDYPSSKPNTYEGPWKGRGVQCPLSIFHQPKRFPKDPSVHVLFSGQCSMSIVHFPKTQTCVQCRELHLPRPYMRPVEFNMSILNCPTAAVLGQWMIPQNEL